MSYQENYQKWLKNVKDEELLNELNTLSQNQKELEYRFSNYLKFSTAGLRGILGAGLNNINIYTISKAIQGLANYLKQNFKKPLVIIAYDNRKYSQRFAFLSAEILAKNNIKSMVFESLTPTPILSYAVRKFKATIGINITSSHNNKTYNGCKFVNQYGAQVNSKQEKEIYNEIEKVDEFKVKTMPLNMAQEKGLVTFLTTSVIDDYLQEAKEFLFDYNFNKNLNVVFTPLNGTGLYALSKGFEMIGINNVKIPSTQKDPDENFTTAPNPNPELEEAFAETLKVCDKNTDLIVACDPDCDRVGFMVNINGKFIRLTGDQVGAILLNYILENKQKNKQLTKNSFFVTSVVSSVLSEKISNYYNVKTYKTLTGFKNIGNKVEEKLTNVSKEDVNKRFTFAYEESIGYMASSNIRDKDGIIPGLLVCTIASKLKLQNKTLLDYLNEIYEKVGYVYNMNYSFEFLELGGLEKIQNAVNKIRNNPPKKIANLKVIEIIDYLDSKKTKLDKQNFIEYRLQKDAKIIVRPSGTEPKLKVYSTSTICSEKKAFKQLKAMQKSINKILFK